MHTAAPGNRQLTEFIQWQESHIRSERRPRATTRPGGFLLPQLASLRLEASHGFALQPQEPMEAEAANAAVPPEADEGGA